VGLIAVTTLLVEHHLVIPPSAAQIDDAGDCERLGVGFEPLENQDPPGIASVIDPHDPGHPGAKAVIDEEMRDASPEERAIWHEEIKRHSPEEIRDILALRRRFSPSSAFPLPPEIQLSSAEGPGPLPFLDPSRAPAFLDSARNPPPRGSAQALAVIESAIDAVQAAEQVVLNNIANANVLIANELVELRRLREQLTTLRRLRSESSGTTPRDGS
jgi:hypothetical protein